MNCGECDIDFACAKEGVPCIRLTKPEPVAARCPDCIGSERPGWKRGMRCATCDGSATVAAPPAAPAPAAPVNVPLPEPVHGFYAAPMYTADQMHDHAAAVSAAKDAEISGLRAERDNMAAAIAQLLRDNRDVHEKVVRPLRERVRVLEDARPEPDCRLCRNFRDCSDHGYLAGWCKDGDRYEPLPPVRLWRTHAAPASS